MNEAAAIGKTMSNGDSIWKFSTAFLAGVVLSLTGAYFVAQKNVATKDDLALQAATQQRQLDDLQRTTGELKTSVIQLDVDTARIAEHLGVPTRPTTHQ